MVHLTKRKGFGKGLGRGYYNLMPKDSYIHRLSAKGVKVVQRSVMWNPKTGKILQGEYSHGQVLREAGVDNKQVSKRLNEYVRGIYDDRAKTFYVRHYFNPKSDYAEFTAKDFEKSEKLQQKFIDMLKLPEGTKIKYNVSNETLRQEGYINR